MRVFCLLAVLIGAGAAALVARGGEPDGPPASADLRTALRHATQARTVLTPPPRSAAPALVTDIVMLDAQRGVLIGARTNTTTAPHLIQRTVDGGARWTTVLASALVELRWIGRDGADLVVAGVSTKTPGCEGSDDCLTPLLLRSSDGGRHWRAIHPRVPTPMWDRAARFAFSARGGALAAPDDVGRDGFGVLRSDDHGRTWRALGLPGGGRGTGVAFTPDGRTAYATSRSRICTSAVSRSDDQGRHWRLLRGACGRTAALLGLAFADARHGFAAGGGPAYRRRYYVIRTADGGRTWRRVWRRRPPLPGPDRLVFADRRHGWALSFGAGDPLLFTSDGGAHWRDTGMPGDVVAPTGRASAFVAVEGRVARTRDGGRSWTDFGSLREVGPATLAGVGDWLVANAAGREFLSIDGGERWREIRAPPAASQAFTAAAGLIVWQDRRGCGRLIVSRDGARTFEHLAGPVGGRDCDSSVAFADARHGLAFASRGTGAQRARLYASGDGGRSWQLVAARGAPRTVPESLAASGQNIVAVSRGRAFISRDGGRSWTAPPLPRKALCTVAAVLDRDVWLACIGVRGGAGSVLFHSADGGRRWRAQVHGYIPFEYLVAVARGRALTPAGDSYDASLLSLDAGAGAWRTVWPALPIGPNVP